MVGHQNDTGVGYGRLIDSDILRRRIHYSHPFGAWSWKWRTFPHMAHVDRRHRSDKCQRNESAIFRVFCFGGALFKSEEQMHPTKGAALALHPCRIRRYARDQHRWGVQRRTSAKDIRHYTCLFGRAHV